MHKVYFVLVPKELEDDEESALLRAEEFLENQEFTGEPTLYSNHKGDWHVIGGRFSAIFPIARKELSWETYHEKLREITERYKTFPEYSDAIEAYNGSFPRAVMFDDTLYNQLMDYFRDEEVEVVDIDDFSEMFLSRASNLTDGSRWIVVVNYHH